MHEPVPVSRACSLACRNQSHVEEEHIHTHTPDCASLALHLVTLCGNVLVDRASHSSNLLKAMGHTSATILRELPTGKDGLIVGCKQMPGRKQNKVAHSSHDAHLRT
jgi:hypothetical protein